MRVVPAGGSHGQGGHLRHRRDADRLGRPPCRGLAGGVAALRPRRPLPEEVRAQIGKGGDLLMAELLPEEEVRRRGKEIEEYRLELFKREYLPRREAVPDGPRAVRADQGGRQADRAGLLGQEGGAGALQADRRDRGPARCRDLLGRRGEIQAPPGYLRGRPRSPGGDRGRRRDRRGRYPLRRPGRRQGRPAHDRAALRRLARAGAPRGGLHGDLPRPGRPPRAITSSPRWRD